MAAGIRRLYSVIRDIPDFPKYGVDDLGKYPELGRKYGVSSKMAGYIIRRQSWTHI